jgi:hypothetical protein
MQIVTGVFIRLDYQTHFNPFNRTSYYKQIFAFLIDNLDLLIDKPIFNNLTNVIIGKIIKSWIIDNQVMICFLLHEKHIFCVEDFMISSHFGLEINSGSIEQITIVGANLVKNELGVGPLVGEITEIRNVKNLLNFIRCQEIGSEEGY